MAKTIVIVGTLDTKGEELKYVKELIEKRGHKTIVIDGGVLGAPLFAPDISREEVAKAAEVSIEELAARRDEGEAITTMGRGASKLARQLYSDDRLDGIIAIGGSMGTTLGLAMMRALPLGVPKVMVSTVAFTSMISTQEVSMDQVMVQCLVDMWGLDTLTKRMLGSAAAAIAAMAETYEKEGVIEKPLIGITTLGTAALNYVPYIKPLLEQRGYEAAVFHAVGTGGRAFEQLIEQGLIAGTLDLCLHELVCNLYGGWCDAGPDRLEAAGKKGIPQVVAPGATGMSAWPGPPESLPPRFRRRKIHAHNPRDTAIGINIKEWAEVAEVMAQKLNQAIGPTVVLIPTRGFFEWDKPGGFFHDPRGRKAFTALLKEHIEPKIKVIELDMHINDPEFSERAVAILDDMMKGQSKAPGAPG